MADFPPDIPPSMSPILTPLVATRPDLVPAVQRLLDDLRMLSAIRYDLPFEILSHVGLHKPVSDKVTAKMALKLIESTKPGEASTARAAAEAALAKYFAKSVAP